MTPCLSSPASSAARSVSRPAVPTTVAAPPPSVATAPSTKPSERRGPSSSTLVKSSARRAAYGLCVAPSPVLDPAEPWHLGHPDAACPAPRAPEHVVCNSGAPRRRRG